MCVCKCVCISVYLSIYLPIYLSIQTIKVCKVCYFADDTNLIHLSKSLDKPNKYILTRKILLIG